MQIEQRTEGNILILKILQKRLDLEAAPALKARLQEAVGKGHLKIVLDLHEVDFVDSSGLGAIVSGLKALAGRGNLVVCGAHAAVRDTFKLTRMDRVVTLVESEQDAIAALSKS